MYNNNTVFYHIIVTGRKKAKKCERFVQSFPDSGGFFENVIIKSLLTAHHLTFKQLIK